VARIIRIVLMVFVLLTLLAFGACGGKDSEAIKDVVNSFYDAWNDEDFEHCLELFSSSLGYSESNIEYMSASRDATGELTITDLEEPVINKETATILIEISPQGEESESIEIPLVKEEGNWKLAGGGLSDRAAEDGDVVRVHYIGTLDDGTEFDSSWNGDPLEFTLGAGGMIPGFENAIYGMKAGETKTVTIPPEEAYGLHDDELLIEVDREDLPAGVALKVGNYLTITYSNGTSQSVPIVEVTETTVTLDANHPLAGEYLTFEITLVGVVSPLAPRGTQP
jgi:peptidylprolyl isomerase